MKNGISGEFQFLMASYRSFPFPTPLTLVTNAVIVWNTRYIQAIIEQLQKEGYTVDENDLTHVSPCRFDHVNKYGKYYFNVDKEQNREQLRPLRQPQNH
jgi:rRNA maturation protein Nop10